MARPRLPDETKRICGTLRKDRTNNLAPVPTHEHPVAPKHLSRAAKKAWPLVLQLVDPVVALSDVIALEALVECLVELREAQATLRKRGGTTYESSTPTGTIHRAYPEVAIVADRRRELLNWLSRFGLTPADRSRVSVNGAPENANPFADLG